jgi:glucokinase
MIDGQFIGVDVGGTKVAVATLERGELTGSRLVPTDTSSSDALLDQLASAIEEVKGPHARAVGIGVPSVIEFETGRIRYSVNIPLADLPLRQLLTDRIGLPVYVDNDANVAALAEAFEGERLTTRELVMITLGTGVGGGLVLGGKIFRGATGAAPEMGHVIVGMDLEDGPPEPAEHFPQPGSLEHLASGRALGRLATRYAREHPESALGRKLAADGQVDGQDAVDLAKKGDEIACKVVDILGRRLGIGIANAINLFDPEEVVIGGGVSTAGDLLLKPAVEVAHRFAVPGVGTKTEIRLARRGPEAGVIGAALLAVQELTEEEQVAQPPDGSRPLEGPGGHLPRIA